MMLSLVTPYYRNPGQLALQYREWQRWSAKARAQIEVVIVDDGSPEPAVDVPRPDGLPELRIFRVLVDKPWRQHGAKNIGAHEAQGPWLLLTDMDHVLTAKAADALLKRLPGMDGGTAYVPHRLEATTMEPTLGRDGKPKPHPNSFVMSRDLYWRVGGYDEEFHGYGTDGQFKTRLYSVAKRGFLKHVPLIRYWRDIVPDASTTTLGRKVPEYRCDTKAVLAKKAAEGRLDQISTFELPWERVL